MNHDDYGAKSRVLSKRIDSDIFLRVVKDAAATIIRKKSWNGFVLLTLRSPRIARPARPGQFLMVRVSDQPYPLLRRPLSIHAREGGGIGIFFSRSGVGTAILAEKKPGDTLDIIGPLGKGFSIPRGLKGKTAVLVGGGRGIAPLYFLAEELRARGIRPRVFYGGKTEQDVPLLEKFGRRKIEVFISTDDGSIGYRGLVSAMLEKELDRSVHPAIIYACGPDPMMRRVAEAASERSIPAQLSLEAVMGCGIGACWGCVRKIRRGETSEWVKICEEGPVFEAPEILWEDERDE
jgi:dihydroorotate dehydrogenase electron transfer subunit